MIRLYKKFLIILVCISVVVSQCLCFIVNHSVYAEEKHYLYSGSGEEVTFSKPSYLADSAAFSAVGSLPLYLMCNMGETYFSLMGFTGYWYTAANLTFSNPIIDASAVKTITFEMAVNMGGGENIIYINEDGFGSVPYFRFYSVNSDGTVNTDKYLNLSDARIPMLNERVLFTIEQDEIAKITNNDGGIETLQWATLHTNAYDNTGFAYFTVYSISYEFYDIKDKHSVTYYIDDKPVYTDTTYYKVTVPNLYGEGTKVVWKTADGKIFDFSKKITENVNLYADFEKIETKISFNSNLGTDVSPIIELAGENIEMPEDPTRDGYTFGGWYKDPKFTVKFNFDKMPNTSVTLYAKWISNEQNNSENDGNNEKEKSGCSSSIGLDNILIISLSLSASIITILVRRKKHGE